MIFLCSTHTHLNQMVKASIKGTREITVMVPAEMAVMRSLKMGSLAMMWKSGSSLFPFVLQIVNPNAPTTNEHFIACPWYMLDIVFSVFLVHLICCNKLLCIVLFWKWYELHRFWNLAGLKNCWFYRTSIVLLLTLVSGTMIMTLAWKG